MIAARGDDPHRFLDRNPRDALRAIDPAIAGKRHHAVRVRTASDRLAAFSAAPVRETDVRPLPEAHRARRLSGRRKDRSSTARRRPETRRPPRSRRRSRHPAAAAGAAAHLFIRHGGPPDSPSAERSADPIMSETSTRTAMPAQATAIDAGLIVEGRHQQPGEMQDRAEQDQRRRRCASRGGCGGPPAPAALRTAARRRPQAP